MSGAWLAVGLLIPALLILGQPLFVVLGALAFACVVWVGGGNPTAVIEDIYFAGMKEILFAIPLFVLAGTLMTRGAMAKRLVGIAQRVTRNLKGGLAIAAVLSCAVFAAISGSSPVTLVAIGSMLYPALKRAKYPDDVSIGVLAAGGTLGIIIPPSIPMVVYGIVGGVSVVDLFIAGILPGLLLTVLLGIYARVRSGGVVTADRAEDAAEVSWSNALPSLLMPVIVLGGIYTGLFSATESAAVAVAYALMVELGFYRELKWRDLGPVFHESATTLGSLFLILLFAVSFNKFLTYQEVPQHLVEILGHWVQSKTAFLIGCNLLLLAVGCLMDALSAILVLGPLLTPLAAHYGVDPVHFGIIVIVNLEIGYLTPPIGINLFVASSVFRRSMSDVTRASLPLVGLLLLGLILVTWLPELSLALLRR